MRFLKSERGIGTIVASVIFLLTSILFIGGTFLWQSTKQAEMNALDKDRMDERVSVQATHKWDKDEGEEGKYIVTVKVRNIGTIDIEIIRLWILDKDHSHGNSHLCIDISKPLAVGGHTSIVEVKNLINSFDNEENPIFDPPEGNPDHPFNVAETTYYFKVVTARGNIFNALLVPNLNAPAVIMPGASYVTDDGYIYLEVYNGLDETITIDLIVATRYEGGVPQTEIIDVELQPPGTDWTLIPGDISVEDFEGVEQAVYTGNIVLIELVNIAGIVISSFYFTVLES